MIVLSEFFKFKIKNMNEEQKNSVSIFIQTSHRMENQKIVDPLLE
jgi:hypothetical protein